MSGPCENLGPLCLRTDCSALYYPAGGLGLDILDSVIGQKYNVTCYGRNMSCGSNLSPNGAAQRKHVECDVTM